MGFFQVPSADTVPVQYPLVSPPVSEVPLYLYELVQYANGRVFDTQSVGLVVHGFGLKHVPSQVGVSI